MKKHVLLGSVLLAAISAFSQSKVTRTGIMNIKELANIKYGVESVNPVMNTTPVKPVSTPVRTGAKTSSITWQNFTGSMNIYGVIISYCKPLQWNDELDAVSFVHRKTPSYVMNPIPASTAASGGMVAMISTDCGNNWDSTALNSNDNYWGRYPGGAIYNPTSNTDISNAYIVGAGPTTGPGAVTWIGNWYASKQLGTANYDNAPSTVTNAQQVMPTTPPFAPGVPSRHDFSAYGFTATDDGKMRVLAGINDDVAGGDTAVMLMTGTFNGTSMTFDWAGKVFDPPTTVESDGTENWISRPIMAWNEQGTVGYVVIIGSRLGATGSNVGYQPIVYKTTNSGSTWSLESSINFNSSAFNDVKSKLWSVTSDTNLIVPNFIWLEGIDCAVDMNNKLHVFTSLLGHYSNDLDSLNYTSGWTTEGYRWPHAPIVQNGPAVHPYLWDFTYDGTSSWSHMLIDSMSTEGPGGTTASNGYQDNPWDADPSASNQKVRIDARIQMSRSADGRHLLYSWAESDTAYTDFQRKWNNLPNIKARLYDAQNSQLSPTEIDLTENAQGEVANHAMYHFISPKFKLISKTTTAINIELPTTISNSSPYAQLTKNTHWYACAGMTFNRLTSGPADTTIVGLGKNNIDALSNSSIFPNPAKNTATVKVSLLSNSKVQVNVLNTIGQVVKSIETQGQIGSNAVNLDLSGLASGIYLVNIKAENASTTKKLVIE
ncbi:T9SS type A sorting domain-containing protein [Aurantibacillus circumpalustris]|uniref:T9SS type A sorting domain-containing protein n=1 Tax=Aurantibacillus circumpalustris TaxID=3036359 RepID=UPI00295BC764|nr:T9SS type A sorting domain-containing protein [Aurantibacillus circumpalustris]